MVRALLGAGAVGLGAIAYSRYIKAVARGDIRTHVVSWLIWAGVAAIGLTAQVKGHAGPGSWVTGAVLVAALAVFVTTFRRYPVVVTAIDCVCITAVIGSAVVWWVTSMPLLSVCIICLIDAAGFLPTARMSVRDPHRESAAMFAVNGTKYVLSIAAMWPPSLINGLYPVSLIGTHFCFVVFLLVRRSQMRREVANCVNKVGHQ